MGSVLGGDGLHLVDAASDHDLVGGREAGEVLRAETLAQALQVRGRRKVLDVIPQVMFGLGATVGSGATGSAVDSPDFTYDNRLGQTAQDWIFSLRDNLTWSKGSHTLKGGFYVEYLKNNEARGGNWMGQFQFNQNSANPLDTGHAFANALLGVYSQYTETDRYRETKNQGVMAEWYLQDTWKATRRLTLDYGVRFLWYTPYWRSDEQVANFVPELFDPAQVPRLYQPATINGQRRALDPVTGQNLPPVFIGAYIPGTGNEANGMLLAEDAPRGFRKQLPPHPEPRIGLSWDLFGNGKTALHASAGLFHMARLGGGSLGNVAANPPFIHNPIINYGTMSTLLTPGFPPVNRPAIVEALEPDAQTPSA